MRRTLQRLSTENISDMPWKYNPILTDRDYLPWDRRLQQVQEYFTRLAYGLGARAAKTEVSWRQTGTADGVVSHTPEAYTSGAQLQASNMDLLRMAPKGMQTPESFSINTDQLIGGHSEAFIDVTEDDTMLFHGTLRVTRDPVRMSTTVGMEQVTDDHVGYAIAEYWFPRFYKMAHVNVRALEVRCRGSQHPFYMKWKTRYNRPNQYHAHMFVPTDDWRCYILRLDHFRNIQRGCEQRTGLNMEELYRAYGNPEMMGFGINCGEEDDFWLEVEYVKFVTLTPEENIEGTTSELRRKRSDQVEMPPKTDEKGAFATTITQAKYSTYYR
eukprot:TRINITY_DN18382_c1_g1_i1.p1 TRINITY_DN18382_c1_g1~~TRINITY_DN18382_c1_g1_i1.p1  ORF type:complete len:327 (+),score=32.61 TRINITY_DN18382_c1_g1_i1:76-1056(+)